MIAPPICKFSRTFDYCWRRRSNKESATAVSIGSDRNGIRTQLTAPMVDFKFMTTWKPAVVMVDYRRPAGR